ncbi:MAG: dihydrodipicolinate synthase family protein [Candidatus Atribacteria bacterium]|nr:MAG: dihydrodipicolinate synthase family protein [Candidatus Atribacteria bacterium]
MTRREQALDPAKYLYETCTGLFALEGGMMANPCVDLSGIFPPIPTPFDSSGNIDQGALKQHLEFLGGFNLRGVVVMGSNGEAVHLSIEERIQLLEVSRDLVPESKLLIAGTGCPSTKQTIEISKRSADIGANAVLVLPPHYYKGRMTTEVLTRHFHAVADGCSVPVILYNMPACTGIELNADTIATIAEHPNIIGLKDSGGDVVKLGALHQRLGDGFQLLAGSASFLLPALAMGAVGGVLALANIAPGQCLAIRQLALAGDWNKAREIQLRMIEVNAAVTQRWGVAGLKAAMSLLGLDGGYVRAPLLDLEASAIDLLKTILIDSQIL